MMIMEFHDYGIPKKTRTARLWLSLARGTMLGDLLEGLFTNLSSHGICYSKKTRSGWRNCVLGPEKSDSASKATHMVLFPGLNSPIQVNILINPMNGFINKFLGSFFLKHFELDEEIQHFGVCVRILSRKQHCQFPRSNIAHPGPNIRRSMLKHVFCWWIRSWVYDMYMYKKCRSWVLYPKHLWSWNP